MKKHFQRVFKFRQWQIIIIPSLIGGVIGSILGKSAIQWDNLIAAISSIGTLGAAFATVWTVREMRAARIISARARITATGATKSFKYSWRMLPYNQPDIPDEEIYLQIRNASQGVGKNIHMNWSAITSVTQEDLENINLLGRDGRKIKIDSTKFGVEFTTNGLTIAKLPISKSDLSYVGDIGPTQSHLSIIPPPIANYAFIKWISLISDILNRKKIDSNMIPKFELSFKHSSPYEPDIVDRYVVEFNLISHKFRSINRRELKNDVLSSWADLEMIMTLDFTSKEIESIPKVSIQ